MVSSVCSWTESRCDLIDLLVEPVVGDHSVDVAVLLRARSVEHLGDEEDLESPAATDQAGEPGHRTPPGTTPVPTSNCPRGAFSREANRRSQASTNSLPAPRARTRIDAMLTNGARNRDAFHLVLPSMPGYGFSGKPTSAGWNPDHIARAWAELVTRLGYTRYVSQGGDWGSVVAEAMGRQAPAGLLGNVNLPATVPADVAAALAAGEPAPDGLSEDERATFDKLATGSKTGGRAYFAMLAARPQNMGYGMADSPAGLAAWTLVHGGFTRVDVRG